MFKNSYAKMYQEAFYTVILKFIVQTTCLHVRILLLHFCFNENVMNGNLLRLKRNSKK